MPASASWASQPEDLVESLSSLDNTARLHEASDLNLQFAICSADHQQHCCFTEQRFQ